MFLGNGWSNVQSPSKCREMENIIIYLKANAWEDQQWFFGLGPLMADVSNNIQLCQAPFTQMGGEALGCTIQHNSDSKAWQCKDMIRPMRLQPSVGAIIIKSNGTWCFLLASYNHRCNIPNYTTSSYFVTDFTR